MADYDLLKPSHRALLDASAVPPEFAVRYRSLDAGEALCELPALGYSDWQAAQGSGLLITLHGVNGDPVGSQFRPDEPYRKKNGQTLRYVSPASHDPVLDVTPCVQPRLRDASLPLVFTEGARKADAIAAKTGWPTVNLSGVWGWRTKRGALGDFEGIALRHPDGTPREVYLMFDSDARSKSEVRLALTRFGEFLRSRGAHVRAVLPPHGPEGEKQGMDDYLALGGDFFALFTMTENAPRSDGELFDSWEPVNLGALGERDPVAPDLAPDFPILYPGKRHIVAGLPESLKTLLLYLVLLLALRNGKRVGVINFEMDEHDARDMFRDLGATDDELAAVVFRSPERRPSTRDIATLTDERLDVVLIDAGAGMYQLEDADDNARKDVERTARKWIDPLRRAGTATVVLDHQAKANGGSWAIGSERKVGQPDVHLQVRAINKLTRGGGGKVRFKIEKDRPGHIRRNTPDGFEVHVVSDPITNAISYSIHAVRDRDSTGQWRPTATMAKASEWIETHPGSSQNKVAQGVGGKREVAIAAIDALEREGYVEVETKGQQKIINAVRPYREADDLFADSNLTATAMPTRGMDVPSDF